MPRGHALIGMTAPSYRGMSGRFGSTSYPRGLSTDLDVVGRYPGHRQRSPTSVYERHQREGGALGAGSTPVAERHSEVIAHGEIAGPNSDRG